MIISADIVKPVAINAFINSFVILLHISVQSCFTYRLLFTGVFLSQSPTASL